MIISVVILVIIVAFCLLPLKVQIILIQQGLSYQGKIKLRVLGILGYTLKFPSASQPDLQPKTVPLPPHGRRWNFVRAFMEINLWLLRHIKCQQFRWKTCLSLGDAAVTGIGCGFLWSLKGYLVSLLQRTVDADQCLTEIVVTPVFNEDTTATEFDCIFNLRMGYIIIAGLRLLVLAIMFKLVLKGAKAA